MSLLALPAVSLALFSKGKSEQIHYFTWLAGVKSFHFAGKDGHFTARRETRKNKDGTARQTTVFVNDIGGQFLMKKGTDLP
jgi:hypothetical protein